MRLGLVGAGSMATALARGWGEPVLCTDGGSGRARALAAETGGEALESNAELAARADLVVLVHKPAQLGEVAAEVAPRARRVVSVLARTDLRTLRAAYPDAQVARLEVNTPVAIRAGVCALAQESDMLDEVEAVFARLGTVLRMPEGQMRVANAVSGVGPAYWTVFVEAWVDAAVRHGMPADTAARLAVATMGGTARLLDAAGHDTLGARRGVTSPGGITARGLAALDDHGVRVALAAAMDAALRDGP